MGSSTGHEATTVDVELGPIGGQALVEGVMMRRGTAWGAAVRRQDGTIGTTGQRLPDPAGVRKVPGVRGIFALADTVVLGTRATLWSARERGDERGDGYSTFGLFMTVVVAVVAVVGIFGLAPAALVKAAGVTNAWLFSAIEGLIRAAILVGYLAALSRAAAVRRVFAYHGAEHMTIHAFEHRRALEPAEIRAFDRRHPRCGTAFLLTVVLITIVAHALVGEPSWAVLIASRILGLLVVAAIAYEVIRFAGRHQDDIVGRTLMAPGNWLQGITTNEPDDDMIEVAIAALEATLAAEVGADLPSATGAAIAAPVDVGAAG